MHKSRHKMWKHLGAVHNYFCVPVQNPACVFVNKFKSENMHSLNSIFPLSRKHHPNGLQQLKSLIPRQQYFCTPSTDFSHIDITIRISQTWDIKVNIHCLTNKINSLNVSMPNVLIGFTLNEYRVPYLRKYRYN